MLYRKKSIFSEKIDFHECLPVIQYVMMTFYGRNEEINVVRGKFFPFRSGKIR